jgi:hypothetical protein
MHTWWFVVSTPGKIIGTFGGWTNNDKYKPEKPIRTTYLNHFESHGPICQKAAASSQFTRQHPATFRSVD